MKSSRIHLAGWGLAAVAVMFSITLLLGSDQECVPFPTEVSEVELEVLAARHLRRNPSLLRNWNMTINLSDAHFLDSSVLGPRGFDPNTMEDTAYSRAAYRLYTEVDGRGFEFSFDDCGAVVHTAYQLHLPATE